MAARLPPTSGDPSTNVIVPSAFTLATALAGPLPLNQAPAAIPLPIFSPSETISYDCSGFMTNLGCKMGQDRLKTMLNKYHHFHPSGASEIGPNLQAASKWSQNPIVSSHILRILA